MVKQQLDDPAKAESGRGGCDLPVLRSLRLPARERGEITGTRPSEREQYEDDVVAYGMVDQASLRHEVYFANGGLDLAPNRTDLIPISWLFFGGKG